MQANDTVDFYAYRPLTFLTVYRGLNWQQLSFGANQYRLVVNNITTYTLTIYRLSDLKLDDTQSITPAILQTLLIVPTPPRPGQLSYWDPCVEWQRCNYMWSNLTLDLGQQPINIWFRPIPGTDVTIPQAARANDWSLRSMPADAQPPYFY